MNDLPDPTPTPEDADMLIKHYGKSIDPERKKALMEKLKAEQEKTLKKGNEKPSRGDRGQSR